MGKNSPMLALFSKNPNFQFRFATPIPTFFDFVNFATTELRMIQIMGKTSSTHNFPKLGNFGQPEHNVETKAPLGAMGPAEGAVAPIAPAWLRASRNFI